MHALVRPRRTKPVSLRLSEFTLSRLRTLAELHNVGYQTLIKEFIVERLYEEERRAGIIEDPPPPRSFNPRP